MKIDNFLEILYFQGVSFPLLQEKKKKSSIPFSHSYIIPYFLCNSKKSSLM